MSSGKNSHSHSSVHTLVVVDVHRHTTNAFTMPHVEVTVAAPEKGAGRGSGARKVWVQESWPEPGLAHMRYPRRYAQWRKELLPKGHPGTGQTSQLHQHCTARAGRGEGPCLHAPLVLMVDRVAKRCTTKVRDSIAARLQPCMASYAAMSLVDLRIDRTALGDAWVGLELICKRYPTLDAIAIADDIRKARAALAASGSVSPADEKSKD